MTEDSRRSWTIREATPDDELGVRRVLDAAMLATDAVPAAIDRGDVLAATADGRVLGACVLVPPDAAPEGAPVDPRAPDPVADEGDDNEGAAPDAHGVPDDHEAVGNGPRDDQGASAPNAAAGDGAHVDAVAVRRRRRGEGIGAALIEAALVREGRLTAAFAPNLRPFYESLGFGIVEGDDRLWGVATVDSE